MLYRAFVLVTIVALFATLAGAQQRGAFRGPSNSIPTLNDDVAPLGLSGSVRTADNKPARDVRVEVLNVMTGQVVAGTYTTPNGTFDISSIASGSYEVRAVAGLDEAHERIDLRAGGVGLVNLRFQPEDSVRAGDRNSVSVAQFKVPEKARAVFKKAEAAIAKQKLDEASKYVEEALTLYPEYSDALTLRGVLKLDAGNAEAACDDLDHAIKADGRNAMAYIAIGAAYNTLSKFDDALRSLDRGAALAPTAWQGYFEMGKAFLGKGSYDAALRQLSKAEGLGPKQYPLIHLVKAHALLGMKNYSEAMAELQWYLEKAPADRASADARQTLEKVRAFAATTPGK